MKIDSFIALIRDLRVGQQLDDADPNNVLLQMYHTPYDIMPYDDTVKCFRSGIKLVWGDGSTYTAYDSNNQAWGAPSCGWLWGAGGRWCGQDFIFPWQIRQ